MRTLLLVSLTVALLMCLMSSCDRGTLNLQSSNKGVSSGAWYANYFGWGGFGTLDTGGNTQLFGSPDDFSLNITSNNRRLSNGRSRVGPFLPTMTVVDPASFGPQNAHYPAAGPWSIQGEVSAGTAWAKDMFSTNHLFSHRLYRG